MDFNVNQIKNRLDRIQVIYTDVDGTFVTDGCLFRNQRGYTLKNATAIYKLLSAGVDVVMTSGREKEKLKDTARILGVQNYIGNLGIEIVYNQGEKVITNFGVDVPDHQSLKNWIGKSGVVKLIFEQFPGKSRYYLPWSDSLRTHHLLIGELDSREISAWVDQNFPEIRIIDNGAVPAEKEFTSPHAYHIVPRNVGKRAAVQIDKMERNLSTEKLIGIGDSMEDMMMADEVAVFFLLDNSIETDQENVIYVDNSDGEAFSRIIEFLLKEGFF